MTVPGPAVATEAQPEPVAVQRKCSACGSEDELLSRKEDRKADNFETSSDIESQLNRTKGGGSALSKEVRSFMEPRFGHDFSQVRVHTDSEAVQMNRELGAQAFTHGSDLYFGAGNYNSGSSDGKQLLAHELTHVVQQTGGVQTKPLPNQLTVQRKCSACEEEDKKLQRSLDLSETPQNLIQAFWGNEEEEVESEDSSGGGVLDWAGEQVGAASDWASETGGAVVDSVTEAGGEALDWATQQGGAVVDSVTEAGGEAVDWASEQVGGAADWITETGGEAVDWATETGGGVADLLMVNDKVTQMLAQLEEALKEYTPLPEGLQKLYEDLNAEKNQLEASIEGSFAHASEETEGFSESKVDNNFASMTASAMSQASAVSNNVAGPGFQDWGGNAGDCGLCLGGPQDAGNLAHKIVQVQFYAENPSVEPEFEIRINNILKGRVDLLIKDDTSKRIEIGEIKPANDQNAAAGIVQLLGYVKLLTEVFPNYKIAALKKPIERQPLTFPTGSKNCPQQELQVRSSSFGLYFYNCKPTYHEMLSRGCRCDDMEPVPFPKEKTQEGKEKTKIRIKDIVTAMGLAAALIVAIAIFFTPVPEPIHKVAAGLTALGLATALLLIMGELRQQPDTSA